MQRERPTHATYQARFLRRKLRLTGANDNQPRLAGEVEIAEREGTSADTWQDCGSATVVGRCPQLLQGIRRDADSCDHGVVDD